MKKWNELKPGDKIFLMIPMSQKDSSHIIYEPQRTELIQSKEKSVPFSNTPIWVIKFKYNDVTKKRKPITLDIFPSEYSNPVLCSSYKMLRSDKLKYGEIICSLDSIALARAYNELLYVEAKKIQAHIDAEYKAITKLTNSFVSSEILEKL